MDDPIWYYGRRRIEFMQSSLKKSAAQKGSILIPVIAFILLAGVFLSLGLDYLELRSPEDDRRRTISDINFLSGEIASYVQKYNRLPCPADPTILSSNPNYGTEARGSGTSCTRREGLIPVRSLYLPEKYMFDSWGRYYTYAISRAYADTEAGSGRVYRNCRTNNTWVFTHSGGTVRNINPAKARFCCPDISVYNYNDDLTVLINGSLGYGQRDTASGQYAQFNQAYNGSPGTQHESPAMALISHGANGVNAYISNGSGSRGTGNFSALEVENADGDIWLNKNMYDPTPATYFDDIVVFKSQFELMAALNDGSCTRPFYSYTPDMLKPKNFLELD